MVIISKKEIIGGLVLVLDKARRSHGEKIKQSVVDYLRLIMDSRHRTERLIVLSLIKQSVPSMHAIDDRI